MFADLHIHSCFSDGTLYPEEIARQAKEKNVSLIAIADHDVLGAWDTFPTVCAAEGLRCLSAVELDSQWGAHDCHILAYGFDLNEREFRAFVSDDRRRLDSLDERLIERMQAAEPRISPADFQSYQPESTRGGWKGLQYLMDRGVTGSLKEGIAYYGRFGCSYSLCEFPALEEVCRHIHRAGGYAVLAHPQDYVPLGDQFSEQLNRLFDLGLDGLECFHYVHREEYTAACLEYCTRNDRIITCGSDFHGSFAPETAINKLMIPTERLSLKGLAAHIV